MSDTIRLDDHYRLILNGSEVDIADAGPGDSLLTVLRERAALTGTKGACEEGECGSCSVLIDDLLVCACLTPAAAAVGRRVVTIEGISAAAASTTTSTTTGAVSSTGGDDVDRASSETGSRDIPSGGGVLSDVQRAFVEAGAVQCGFCTPGFIVAIHALVDRSPNPSEIEVREALSGNICRCTGYGRILDAVARVVVERSAR